MGKDGKYYIVDFARLFPPEKPIDEDRSESIFYEYLRPSVVLSSSKPLNSDSFSEFVSENDPETIENEKTIELLTERIYSEIC